LPKVKAKGFGVRSRGIIESTVGPACRRWIIFFFFLVFSFHLLTIIGHRFQRVFRVKELSIYFAAFSFSFLYETRRIPSTRNELFDLGRSHRLPPFMFPFFRSLSFATASCADNVDFQKEVSLTLDIAQ